MPRLSAVAVLRRMMDELAADNWPTEQTWADACRVTGRPIPPPIVPPGTKWIGVLEATIKATPRKEP